MTLSNRQLLLIALLPIVAYLLIFHPATLDPTNCGWLIRGTDNGENALGFHAYLHDPASGWWPRTSLLNHPDGVTLLFTDSNPLLALMVKPFAPWLPVNFQLVGPWVLACFVLQALFSTLLLRRHAPSFIALWCGVALFLMLPTLPNRFIHTNLMAHWLILWSLWLFLDPRRAGDLRWWAAVMIATAMIHNYLLLMVAAIWASAMLERFVAGDTRTRAVLTAGSLGILGVVAIILRAHSGGAHFQVSDAYGAFAMSLDSLWNPANQSYSAFLPATEQRQGRGFEGFQYLGAGLLLLVPVALAIRLTQGSERSDLRRLLWLVPALSVLTLLAISPFVDIAGQKLLRLPIPMLLAPALDTVRASGRLFWPVAYVLLLVSIRMAFRLRGNLPALLLALIVAVQFADIRGMYTAIHAESDEAGERRLYLRTPSPEWDRAMAAAKDVSLAPADSLADLSLFQEIAWHAAAAGKPIRHVYAARMDQATRQRLRQENLAFARGDLDPHRLYVLLPNTRVPAAGQRRLAEIDGVRVLLPGDRRNAAPQQAR